MTFTIPDPSPEGGFRRLSAREAAQRARAMECIRDPNPTKCKGQIFVSIFFDGTGNNADWQEPGKSGRQRSMNYHSNVARLFDSHRDEPESGLFAHYIPGVGTPFDKVNDSGQWYDGKAGGAAGRKGSDRINWALVQLLNSAHTYLTNAKLIPDAQATTIVGNISSFWRTMGLEGPNRRWVLRHWEDRLKQVNEAQNKKLVQINVSVFGFSRGAALARAFAHWLAQIASADGDGFTLAGVPIRLSFMGIFDTVASVGIPDSVWGADGHMAWADGTMSIHPIVEQCVHFAALHEQRSAFPVEDANVGKQRAYPGMHSDVGGGYAPSEQGKSMASWGSTPQLSQVALVDMHYEAVRSGVPVLSADEIQQLPRLASTFAIAESTRTAFNAWAGQHGCMRSGSLNAMSRSHTEQYQRYRGLRLQPEQRLEDQRFFKEAASADAQQLREANDDLRAQISELQWRADAASTQASPAYATMMIGGGMPVAPMPPTLSTEDARALERFQSPGDVPLASIKLFDDFVHDSRAGFRVMGMMELRGASGGYVRYRRVFNQS